MTISLREGFLRRGQLQIVTLDYPAVKVLKRLGVFFMRNPANCSLAGFEKRLPTVFKSGSPIKAAP